MKQLSLRPVFVLGRSLLVQGIGELLSAMKTSFIDLGTTRRSGLEDTRWLTTIGFAPDAGNTNADYTTRTNRRLEAKLELNARPCLEQYEEAFQTTQPAATWSAES